MRNRLLVTPQLHGEKGITEGDLHRFWYGPPLPYPLPLTIQIIMFKLFEHSFKNSAFETPLPIKNPSLPWGTVDGYFLNRTLRKTSTLSKLTKGWRWRGGFESGHWSSYKNKRRTKILGNSFGRVPSQSWKPTTLNKLRFPSHLICSGTWVIYTV